MKLAFCTWFFLLLCAVIPASAMYFVDDPGMTIDKLVIEDCVNTTDTTQCMKSVCYKYTDGSIHIIKECNGCLDDFNVCQAVNTKQRVKGQTYRHCVQDDKDKSLCNWIEIEKSGGRSKFHR